MNVSALFSFPGQMLCAYGIIGIVFIAGGLLWYYLGSSKRPLKRAALGVLFGQALHWRVPQDTLVDFSWSLSRFGAWCLIGVGLGSLLLAVIGIGLLMSPVWSQICPFSIGNLPVNAWALALALGGGGGGLYAFRRLRAQASTSRSDGPQRTLRDYRSPLFFVIPPVWFVLICVLVFAFHPSYMPGNNCLIDNRHFIIGSWQWWISVPLLVLAGATLLSMELLQAGVASARSPLVPTDFSDVAGLDDMFRDRIIKILQYWELMQMSLLSIPLFSLVSLPDPYSVALIFAFLALIILSFMSLLTAFAPGGLGGRLSDWFWQRRRAS